MWNHPRSFLFPSPRGPLSLPSNACALTLRVNLGRRLAGIGANGKTDQSGGVVQLIFQDERERDRRRKTEDDADARTAEAPRPRKRRGQTGEVGDALRTVYQRAIDEDIPPEMLDLLGKLG